MRDRVNQFVLGLADWISYKASIISCEFVADVFSVRPCKFGHE